MTLAGPTVEQVRTWWSQTNRQGYAVANESFVVVCDRQSEAEDGSISNLAGELSDALGCAALAVFDHDDDVLFVELFEAGQAIDRYDSAPGYFEWDGEGDEPAPVGGDASVLTRVFGGDPAEVETVLRGEYDFAFERHRDLVTCLSLPLVAVGLGFEYLARGDLPAGLSTHSIIEL